MSDIDQPGQFYLGREYDPKAGKVTDRAVFYPARHLTTHAVLLGMTGSGKTGLGIIFLEEALLQGLPVLAVDPKGDLTNLLLTFPNLTTDDFVPWVDAESAQREGLSVEQAAARDAKRWREGLAQWGIGSDRIARLRQAADWVLFTPGSDAGTPVDVLHRFETPQLDWETHAEVLRERIAGLVTAVLGLAGRETDPLQNPEHVLLSHIVEHAWRAGEPLDLPTLIRRVQDPPIRQIGVFDLESFLPQKDRLALARALNNVFAAPNFAAWREGVPLEVADLLRTADGRPRASIFYLSHLQGAERAFFITLLLEAARGWMAAQSGTSDLRLLLYFDEVFGFFPPYPANPPTKEPLMALIKQGRAVGLGVVLATQNPIDLDYKGLTNAGTWAVGTLRTDRDKERVLEGLEGAAAAAGAGFDRGSLDRALAGLRPRVFLLHDVYADAPVFFHTRWAMSYLRGPLTRAQIRQLTTSTLSVPGRQPPARRAPPPPETALSVPPALPADVFQVFIPASVTADGALQRYKQRSGQQVLAASQRLVYRPHLLALGTVYLNDERRGVRHRQTVARLVEPDPPPAPLDWDKEEVHLSTSDLSRQPVGEGSYLPVPAHLAQAANYTRWNKSFADFLYRNVRVSLWYNPALKLYGLPGESERDFRRRCEETVRARRDAEIAKARAEFEKQVGRLQERLRREERELAEDRAELEGRKREEVFSIGESALNLLAGRRASRLVSTATRKRRLTKQAEAEVEESEAVIKDLRAQLEGMAAKWEEQERALNDRWVAVLEENEQVDIAPRRTDIVVDFCGLAWVPAWEVVTQEGQRLTLPGYQSGAATPE